MGLFDLLTPGEQSLHSRLGRWRQRVSQVLDGVVAQGTDRPLDILEARRALSNDIGIGAGSDIRLNQQLFNQGDVVFNESTGVFSLVAGRTYEMTGSLSLFNFSAAVVTFLINWVDADTNAVLPGAQVSGTFFGSTTTNADCPSPSVHAVHRATISTRRVKMRVIGATGTADLTTQSVAIVKELR